MPEDCIGLEQPEKENERGHMADQVHFCSPWFTCKIAIKTVCVCVCVQQTYPPVTGQMAEPYSGRAGSYDGNLAAAEEQENYERSRQMDEFGESMRERRRDRDRDYDSERDRDRSRRHRSGDR